MSGGPVFLHYDAGSEAELLWHARGPHSTWGALQVHEAGEPELLPKVALLLIGDGRDALRAATVDSFARNVTGYRLGGVAHVDDHRHAMGFGGAIQMGWHYLRQLEADALEAELPRPFDYVFHLEEDWLFRERVDLRDLAAILETRNTGSFVEEATLAQVALRRGPVNQQERAAGGVVEQWPDEYADREVLPIGDAPSVPFLEHALFFTTNPSLYRASLMMLGWPDGAASEAAFTQRCLDFGHRFAYYGARSSAPTIEHTGVRTGTGY